MAASWPLFCQAKGTFKSSDSEVLFFPIFAVLISNFQPSSLVFYEQARILNH